MGLLGYMMYKEWSVQNGKVLTQDLQKLKDLYQKRCGDHLFTNLAQKHPECINSWDDSICQKILETQQSTCQGYIQQIQKHQNQLLKHAQDVLKRY